MTAHDDVTPSGNEAFDRAPTLLARLREEEALDWFQIAADAPTTPRSGRRPRRSSPGSCWPRPAVGGRASWAEVVRENAARPDLGDLLDAAAHLQLGEVDAARTLLDAGRPTRPIRWFPASVTAARIARAHVMYLDGDVDEATRRGARRVRGRSVRARRVGRIRPVVRRDRLRPDRVRRPHPRRPRPRSARLAAALGAGGRRPHRGAHLGAQPRRPACARARAVVRGEARQHARAGVVGAHPRGRHGPPVPAGRPRRGPHASTPPSGSAPPRSRTRRSATAGRATRSSRPFPRSPTTSSSPRSPRCGRSRRCSPTRSWSRGATTPARSLLDRGGAVRGRRAAARPTRCSCTACRSRPPRR